MNATRVAEMETLRRTVLQLARAGLVIDAAILSPTHRRAFFALQCRMATGPTPSVPTPAPIGFPYPNAR